MSGFDEWWIEYRGDAWNRDLARDAFEAGQFARQDMVKELRKQVEAWRDVWNASNDVMLATPGCAFEVGKSEAVLDRMLAKARALDAEASEEKV